MKPDFVIAGAAKCGTTALFEYLSRHPSVFMPRMKEPKFFCPDLKTIGGAYSLAEYEALFASASARCLTGEASAMYLYSTEAIPRIMAHNPQAKIIVILRNPVDAAHSLHAARWSHGHESVDSFEEAWRLQPERLVGEHVPERWPDPATLQYGAIYRYAPQVRRVLEHVPASQRYFIVYEEFFADQQRGYSALLGFLGLSPHELAHFPVVNPSIGPRSDWLHRQLRSPPSWLRALYAPVRPLARAAGARPMHTLRILNSTRRAKTALRPEFRAELQRYFSDDIAELEALLGRTLWREVSRPESMSSSSSRA